MRLDWIDICKAIAIFAMVFCHVGLELPSQNAALSNWIHLWHMPIFFILSGIVLNQSKYLGWSNFKSFLVNRLKTLILPYFCFGFICISIGYVLNIIVGLGGLSVKEILLAFVINNERIPYGGIQWFLTALFFCELFYVVVANIIGTKKITIIVFLLFWLVGFFCRYLDGSVSSIPFSILPAIFATPFFAIGFLFKDKIKNFAFNHCWEPLICLAFTLGLFLIDGIHINMRTSIYSPVYSIVIGGIVSLIIILLVKKYEKAFKRLLVYSFIGECGKNTLIILLLNAMIRKVLLSAIHFGNNAFMLLIIQVISTITIISVILAVSRLINKFCPQILGKF